MNLYALLIGINEYEFRPLQQCVNDVHTIEAYLLSLSDQYTTIEIQKLLDHKATKTTIVASMTTLLAKAEDNDVVLIYYSGHGALENASGRFSDAHSGTIECLVCYAENKTSSYLLADKEIRFLVSKIENSPHIVTVFDCCHSGDMVRNFTSTNAIPEARQRKLSAIFEARTYTDFIFADEISEAQLRSSKVVSLLPHKNTVHLAACLSSESAWEDGKGGVFTRCLVQLLKTENSYLSYLEIAKWAKISILDTTQKKQTPTITIQGQGAVSQYSSWLNLYPKKEKHTGGFIYFNTKNGWYYNRGRLFGIQKGTEIEILVDKTTHKKITSNVLDVSLEHSLIQDPIELGVLLDFSQRYHVTTKTMYNPMRIYIHDLDKDIHGFTMIKKELEKMNAIILSEASDASFFVTLFNQTVYISLPEDPFRPLTNQMDLLSDTQEKHIRARLQQQIDAVSKWHFFNTLQNPDAGFPSIPIKVEIKVNTDTSWIDITDSIYGLTTLTDQRTRTGEYFQKYQIRVTNVSKEAVYVSALAMCPDFSISSDPLDHLSKLINPNEFVLFYEHRNMPFVGWSFDAYKEIYNWKNDWLHYKFIVTRQEDITTTLPDMNQEALPTPITHFGNQMGHGSISDFLPSQSQWGVYTTTLTLANPTYNIVGEKIRDHWEYYSTNEVVAPFINALYTAPSSTGFEICTMAIKPNAKGDTDLNTRNLMNLKIKLGNHLDDKRRYRRFRKSKKLFPELPVIVAEGDSWFLFPFLVKDTLDYVMEKYPLRSIAAAGDALQNYRISGQLIETIEKEKPKYVLISGGGNDIIGPGIEDMLKNNIPAGMEPAAYLNEEFVHKMEMLEGTYNYFFNRIASFDFVKQVFVHGYDYVRTDHPNHIVKNGWVNRYLIAKGIEKPADRQSIIGYLIDQFNHLLYSLSEKHKNATYVNMRSLVQKDEWYDEIHPNDQGFAKVGAKFLKAINQLEYTGYENMQK